MSVKWGRFYEVPHITVRFIGPNHGILDLLAFGVIHKFELQGFLPANAIVQTVCKTSYIWLSIF